MYYIWYFTAGTLVVRGAWYAVYVAEQCVFICINFASSIRVYAWFMYKNKTRKHGNNENSRKWAFESTELAKIHTHTHTHVHHHRLVVHEYVSGQDLADRPFKRTRTFTDKTYYTSKC